MGMAKSGDDLMRWQNNSARGERRCCRPKNIPCRSTEHVGKNPSVLGTRLVKGEMTSGNDFNGRCFELFGGFGYEWRVGGL